jgi:hypothetical protein
MNQKHEMPVRRALSTIPTIKKEAPISKTQNVPQFRNLSSKKSVFALGGGRKTFRLAQPLTASISGQFPGGTTLSVGP